MISTYNIISKTRYVPYALIYNNIYTITYEKL